MAGRSRRFYSILALTTLGLLAGGLVKPAAAHTPVTFRTSDGVLIRGYQFGNGRTVVILSHMYGTTQRI